MFNIYPTHIICFHTALLPSYSFHIFAFSLWGALWHESVNILFVKKERKVENYTEREEISLFRIWH